MKSAVEVRPNKAATAASRGVPPKNPGDDHSGYWGNEFRAPRVWKQPPVQFSMAEAACITASTNQFWVYADAMPRNHDLVGMRGRKPKSADYVKALIVCMSWTGRSMLAVITELSFAPTWAAVRESLNALLPEGWDPAPEHCPSLSQMKSFNAKLRRKDSAWREELAEAVRRQAIADAQAIGCLDPCRGLSWAQPDPRDFVALDGTVLLPAFGSGDDDSKGPQIVFNDEKMKKKPYGSKLLTTQVRAGDTRVILDARMVAPGPNGSPGGESRPIENALFDIAEAAKGGLSGVMVDSVVRGELVSALEHQGITVVNYPHAKENPNRATGGRRADGRVEKHVEFEPMCHEAKGSKNCQHALVLVGSVPHTRMTNANGEELLVPLRIIRGFRRKNSDGTFRAYHVYEVPCFRGNFEHTQRLFPTGPGSLNHGEYVRYFPVDTDQFTELYGRRNATESWHAELKRTRKRTPVRGMHMQDIYLVGMMVMQNALSLERLKRASAPPETKAA